MRPNSGNKKGHLLRSVKKLVRVTGRTLWKHVCVVSITAQGSKQAGTKIKPGVQTGTEETSTQSAVTFCTSATISCKLAVLLSMFPGSMYPVIWIFEKRLLLAFVVVMRATHVPSGEIRKLGATKKKKLETTHLPPRVVTAGFSRSVFPVCASVFVWLKFTVSPLCCSAWVLPHCRRHRGLYAHR